MNRKSFFMAIVIALVVAGGTGFAQQQRRPYDQIMKDIGATFGTLRKNLEANNAAAAAEDAAKLEGFFAETEAFWVPFNTKDATGFAKRGREAAAAIGTAAKGNDIKAAQASVAVVQGTCANCHRAHRQQTASGYLIKP